MKDELILHQERRKQIWIEAWVRVAGANDCKSYDTATKWADEALKKFDERFRRPTPEQHG